MNQDTICAIATAQGGAIGSIRVPVLKLPRFRSGSYFYYRQHLQASQSWQIIERTKTIYFDIRAYL